MSVADNIAGRPAKLARLFKRHWPRITLSLAITAFFLLNASHVTQWGFITLIENIAYDARLRATMPGDRDDRIVIIDVDEKSLAQEGRWPWPRNRVARLVNQLFDEYKITMLGMDVVWAEADESSGLKVLENLADDQLADNQEYLSVLRSLRPALSHDDIFAQSLRNRPVVLGYYFNINDTNKIGALPQPVFTSQDFNDQRLRTFVASGYGANLPDLHSAAADAGYFNYAPDTNIVRKAPMLIRYQDGYYAPLSLAMVRQLMGGSAADVVKKADSLQIGGYQIPVDENTQAIVPYRGPQGSFRYVSAGDILSGDAATEWLAGKIALLGTSAPGLLDLISTPVQVNYPGVEVHANLVAGFIDQKIKHKPEWIAGVEIIMVLLIGLLMSLWLSEASPLKASLLSILILSATVLLSTYVWQSHNAVLPVASTLLLVITLYIVNMSYGFFIESRGKYQLAEQFGQYIPPEIVAEMAYDPERFSLAGENRHMTVFFSDVRDFTSISESFSDPTELQTLINAFLTPVTRIIHQHRGTIDKYMGDAVMAFWGAPRKEPQHASYALHAALDIVAMMRRLGEDFKQRGWPALNVGIGIHTGTMHVGDMGSQFRKAYTVMGDAVNIGSRLEGLTKEYGASIIVSEDTKNAVEDLVYRELDGVRVKGKDKPIVIFEPLGKKDDISDADKHALESYAQAREHYKTQQWTLAEAGFLDLQKQSPEARLYAVYLQRIRYFVDNPPGEHWDGVFTHKTK